MNTFIEINEFPAVIAAADVKQLRLAESSSARSLFMRSYLGFDEHARFTLQSLIDSLSKNGGAYFINGVFGSGKSHLLGILTLLGDGLGHADFLQAHPQFAAQINSFPKRFTVYFSLDEYDGSRLSLEEITWREIGLRAQQLGFEINPFDAKTFVSRSEQLLVLEENLHQQGYSGLQLCVDELSLFLGAKDHRSLQSEASWLQFLGQRAARESTFSLWCCFTLQKEWQDVGDLEPYSLSQVRDRFQTLTLSMAHLPSLVKHRLVHQKDSDAVHQLCHLTYGELTRAWPQIDFGIAEWEELYPFHPATIELLEQVSSRFFSRTRSAVLFCSHALKRYIRDATNAERITASQIFNYFQPEYSQYPELKELDRVWRVWEEMIPRLARDKTEIELYKILLKTLLLFRLSGHDITAIQLANTLSNDLNFGAGENYRYVHQLLLRWCKEGDHLSVERGDDWQQDRFSVTLGQSIQQTIRRHTRRVLETLQSSDARIVSHLLKMCDGSTFPLKTLLSGTKQIQIDWQNSPRQTEVTLWQNSGAQLQNQLLNWRQHSNTDVYLFLKVPFVDTTFPDLSEVPERTRAALLLWQPRKPTGDEWEFARETTARFMLHHDPALRDNRRGRAIIKFLERDLKERAKEMQQFMIRLYCEGRLISGDKRYIEITELCHQRNWEALIPTISSFALEILYCQFHQVSPAVKVLSSSQINQLGSRLLQQKSTDIWWPASLDRPVRAIAVPLGLAAEDKGRWKYAAGKDELIAEIESLLAEDTLPVPALEARMSVSVWGLLPQQTDLLLCGMLGAGRIEAVDAQAKVLLPAQLRMPLAQSNHGIRRAALIKEESWKRVCSIIKILCGYDSLPLDFAAQMKATQWLRDWYESTFTEMQLTNARLRQLQKSLDDNNTPFLWQRTTETIDRVKVLLQTLNVNNCDALLETAAALDTESTTAILQSWQELQSALDANQTSILQLSARLSHPQIISSQNLTARRDTLLQQFLEGEKVLFNTQLLQDAKAWDDEFHGQYQDWHQQQFTDERWQELRKFTRQKILQAFHQLKNVSRYPFPNHFDLIAQLQMALRRQCPRDGSLLPGEVSCNQCQLRMGQIVELPNLELFSEKIKDDAHQLWELFQSEEVKRHLQCSVSGLALINWNGNTEELLPLLDEQALSALEQALMPRQRFQRSLKSLNHQIGNGGTRAELESTFKNWIEANDAVGAEDEIAIINEFI